MSYYSHSTTREDGTTVGSKLLAVHTQGVLDKALHHWHGGISFDVSNTQIKALLEDIVRFHDLGKYTPYFQNYLLKRPPIDQKLKQHARFGGYAAYQRWLDKGEQKLAIVALLLIYRHHSYLFRLNDLVKKLEDGDNQKVFNEQLHSIEQIIKTIEQDSQLFDLKSLLVYPNVRGVRRAERVWVKKQADIQDYYLCNYLFSLLIEGDKLDASETEVYHRKPIEPDLVDRRFGTPAPSDAVDLSSLNQNEIRNFCRSEVVAHLGNEDVLGQRIFTLTAPTGIGKTMTALDFALKLKDKISKTEGYEPQLIYALPFINIIEQALSEYEKTLAQSSFAPLTLGHYQFADIFGNPQDGDESGYEQKLMQLDTWQSDIVITSFVQFFETLICNRNKLLKKFNHYAGSIIILDEVQTLRLDYMPLIGAALHYLAKFLNARIILMTATKPKIFELAEKEILTDEGETVRPLELLTSHDKVFALFNRTTIHPKLTDLEGEPEERSQSFMESLFPSLWSSEKSCIIVCNTVNRSIFLHDSIKDYCDEHGLNNPVFYLSTNIAPVERMERIEQIKQALGKGIAPVLIATQVVEAGVDIDFDMGFRDLGPIDSIIQVAGRINRHDDHTRSGAPLYIVDFAECDTIYGKLTATQARKALREAEAIPEKDYLNLITKYFDDISGRLSFMKSRAFFASMKTLKYDHENWKEEHPVSAFRIIEQSSDYRSVFIELDEESSSIRDAYLNKIIGQISKEDFDRTYKRSFQQRIISVPKKYTHGLEAINQYDENILLVPLELLNTYYDRSTGFKRETESNETYMF
jgi:CRISPR-associated endonuclease/helicase Cas3